MTEKVDRVRICSIPVDALTMKQTVVIQEPGRLWKRYLVTNTMFIYLILREKLFPASIEKIQIKVESSITSQIE